VEEITTLANTAAFFLHSHASASYARRRLLCFHCFPMSVSLSRYKAKQRCVNLPPDASLGQGNCSLKSSVVFCLGGLKRSCGMND